MSATLPARESRRQSAPPLAVAGGRSANPALWWAAVGAFAIVVEGVVEPLARAVTAAVACPTIDIGESPACDGQVLVVDDMLGMFERVPRFVKRFDDLAVRIDAAAATYAAAVRERSFPGDEQLYRPTP